MLETYLYMTRRMCRFGMIILVLTKILQRHLLLKIF
nr:MAG TPA: hypothetical protein [Caudoviricetes sp.]